jgi:hypothetical protein
VDPSTTDLWQNPIEFAEPNEWFTADYRQVQRLIGINELDDPTDEFVTLEVVDLLQENAIPEVLIAVGITSGARQWTLTSYLDREKRRTTRKNAFPPAQDLQRLHSNNLTMQLPIWNC